ncbi:MAG: flagellar biosynthetic protein FliR [Nitrospirota bacterium]
MTSTAIHLTIPEFQTFLVVLFRVGGIMAALPILGSRNIPAHIKIAIAVVIGLVLVPNVHPPHVPADPLLLTAGVVSELAIGLMIGLAVRLLFSSLEIAGEVMGAQMGFGIVQLLDPFSSHQTPLVSHFQVIVASMTFLSLNAHFLLVRAVADSFEMIRPFGASLTSDLVEDVLHLTHGMFVVALKVAAPVLAASILVNVMLGILGRAVAQMNVFVLSFPVTIGCGLLVMGIALPYAQELYQAEFGRLLEAINGLLGVLGHG